MTHHVATLAVAALIWLAAPLSAATYTVTTTADSGAGSLRQAILDANANLGLDTIEFNILGSGVHTITPVTPLPAITDAVIIDGYTQPGASPNTLAVGDDAVLLIELTGTAIVSTGLQLQGTGGSTVRGLVMNQWGVSAIRVGFASPGNGNVIEGNFLGTDPTGMTISGNTSWLLYLFPSSANNRIGGTTPAARNIIAGNAGGGGSNLLIELSNDNLVQGNYFGVNAAGVAALPTTTQQAIVIRSSSGNIVGGTAPGAGNVIYGPQAAIRIQNVNATPTNDNVIQGNYIGTDATGTVGQGGYGIVGLLTGAGSSNTIGGAAPGAGNLISGTAIGILIDEDGDWIVQGNRIGTDASGTSGVPNSVGIQIDGPAAAGQIGGIGPGEANTIAFNSQSGVVVKPGSVDWTIRGNSIFANGSLGIDLQNPAGPSPNDPGDGDDGGNHLQNFPILQSVEHLGPQGNGSTRIVGKLGSAPSTTYDVDFYSNPACSNFPREFLEGQTYLGSTQVTTDGNGDAAFDVTLAVSTESGARISATATDPDGSTSELSQRIVFSISPASGPDTGGTPFTVNGTDFADPTTITVGGTPATGVTFVNDHQLNAAMPAFAPGTSHDVVATTTDGTTGTLVKGWVADFLDVPQAHIFHNFVVTLVSNGITVGVGGGNYGVTQDTLRQQMAVFLLRAKYGLCYTPPPCTVPVFDDVPCSLIFAPWINELVAQGITGGCGGGSSYCPTNPVLRQQMAVLLLRTLEGTGYTPPACTVETFTDVPCSSPFAPWIYELVARSITAGCGGGLYCPTLSANRGQMATFLTKTFNLQ